MKKDTLLIVISHFIQLVSQFIIIRTLNFEYGPSIYGAFIIIIGVLNLSGQITMFPLNNFFQLRFAVKNKFQLRDFVLKYSSIIFSFIIALLGLVIFGEFKLHTLAFGLAFLIFTLQYNSILVYFNSKAKHKIFSSLKIIHNLIYISTIILSCHYFSFDFNYLMVVLTLMYLIEVALLLFYLYRKKLIIIEFSKIQKLILDDTLCKKLKKKLSQYLEFSLPLALIAILTYITGSSERYFTKIYFSDEMVGIYASIYLIATKPYVFSKGIIETILRPKMYLFLKNDTHSHENFHKYRYPWFIVCTFIIFIGLIFNLFFWELYSIIIPEEYLQYKDLLLPLTLAYLPFLCGQYYRRILLRSSENKILLKIEIFVACFTLLVYLIICILIPKLIYLSFVPFLAFLIRFILLTIEVKKIKIINSF